MDGIMGEFHSTTPQCVFGSAEGSQTSSCALGSENQLNTTSSVTGSNSRVACTIFSLAQVEGRYKTILAAYTKYKDNFNRTGAARKDFNYVMLLSHLSVKAGALLEFVKNQQKKSQEKSRNFNFSAFY